MKLKEFLKFVKENNLDENLELIISSDAEGNNFSPIDEVYTCNYIPFNSYSGEIYFDDEEEDTKPEHNALVFYPVN